MSGTNTSSTGKAAESTSQETKTAARDTIKAVQGNNPNGAGFMKLPEESLRFASHRFERQMAHVKSLMECQSPSEFFDTQNRFATESVQEYLEETHRVVDLAAEIGTDYISEWSERAKASPQ